MKHSFEFAKLQCCNMINLNRLNVETSGQGTIFLFHRIYHRAIMASTLNYISGTDGRHQRCDRPNGRTVGHNLREGDFTVHIYFFIIKINFKYPPEVRLQII